MEELLEEFADKLESDYMDKYVDEEFLRWVFDKSVEFDGTHQYVCNGFEYGGKSPFILAVGGYDKKEKKIKFFDMALAMMKNEVHNDMKVRSDSRKYIATNLLMLKVLFHELEHVNQEKKRVEDDTLEGQLLRAQEGNEERISTYNYIPSERFAEDWATKKTLFVLRRMGFISPMIDDYLEDTYNFNIVKSYTDEENQCVVHPIKRYMDMHNQNFSDISLSEAMETYPDIDDRVYLGLPITEEEYATLREKAKLNNTGNKYSL